jgi:nicotinate-nucleotide--dimethylbenzimidazole phosphoribosyltransferase
MSIIPTQLASVIDTIQPLDMDAQNAARQRQSQLTKPAGSLGRLEDLAVQLAGIQQREVPSVARKAVIVMAADHGVTAEGISAYPSEVTPQMVLNFLNGGAAINVLAKDAGALPVFVDIGVAADFSQIDISAISNAPLFLERKIVWGTANMAQGPAMTAEQATKAIIAGIDAVDVILEAGLDIVATGEMGIGNTTASSAITAALLRVPAEEVTGRGTGIDDQQLAHKVTVIERALAVNAPDADNPLDVLAKVGGLEIAGLVGVILGAASHRIAIVLDGFISGAAALVAVGLCPAVRDYLIAGHTSIERGHRVILEHLQLIPLLDLGMRLGEGSGAMLAMHIIDAAVHTHAMMATFASAGVSERLE